MLEGQMGRFRQVLARAVIGATVTTAGLAVLAGTAHAAVQPGCEGRAAISTAHVHAAHPDGTSDDFESATQGSMDDGTLVRPGDTLTITFTRASGCEDTTVSLGSYAVSSSGGQTLVSSDSAAPGDTTLTIHVPSNSGTTTTSTQKNKNAVCDGSTNSDKGVGANRGGPYDNTCPAGDSQNGKSTNNNSSKPCAGCVGNADDKNPGAQKGTNGQYPNGSDHNAGNECDTNQGIGQSNPAHTGCSGGGYQVDFVTGSL